MKPLHIAIIYNSYMPPEEISEDDHGQMADLRMMVRDMARQLRKRGHTVSVVPLTNDLFKFMRRLRRLNPDVVFNQYDDVVFGAVYESRVASLVRMMGYPMTGAPALALGICRYKYMATCLLKGAGVPVPPDTEVISSPNEVNGRDWKFPLIVQPSQEHASIGLDRTSVVHNPNALRRKVRHILQEFKQPAIVQSYLPGREFNVSILGGSNPRILPLAEIDYSAMPEGEPRIMSYNAKWVEHTLEFDSTGVKCPAEVDPKLEKEIHKVSLHAFRAMRAWGYARVDVRLDAAGKPCVLEINCNPCLDDEMGYNRAVEAAGLTYPDILEMVIEVALEKQPFDEHVPMVQPLPGLVAV